MDYSDHPAAEVTNLQNNKTFSLQYRDRHWDLYCFIWYTLESLRTGPT